MCQYAWNKTVREKQTRKQNLDICNLLNLEKLSKLTQKDSSYKSKNYNLKRLTYLFSVTVPTVCVFLYRTVYILRDYGTSLVETGKKYINNKFFFGSLTEWRSLFKHTFDTVFVISQQKKSTEDEEKHQYYFFNARQLFLVSLWCRAFSGTDANKCAYVCRWWNDVH